MPKMTDEQLVQAKELDEFAKHIAAADLVLQRLRKRSGRDLTVFCESGQPFIIDNERDGRMLRNGPGSRAADVTRGGVVVRGFLPRTIWDGGGW